MQVGHTPIRATTAPAVKIADSAADTATAWSGIADAAAGLSYKGFFGRDAAVQGVKLLHPHVVAAMDLSIATAKASAELIDAMPASSARVDLFASHDGALRSFKVLTDAWTDVANGAATSDKARFNAGRDAFVAASRASTAAFRSLGSSLRATTAG